MLKEWGNDINKKSEEEKRSLKGKVGSAMHAQTVTYMKPMFRKLKSRVSNPNDTIKISYHGNHICK